MNKLSENELLIIFNFLDNNSMWNAMRTCKRWAQVFRNSSKLLRKFKLSIYDGNISIMISKIDILEVNFKNMSLTKTATISGIPEYLKDSMEILELNDINITVPKIFDDFFSGFKNLKILKLRGCSFEMFSYSNASVFPSLTTVSFKICSSNTYNIFKKLELVRKLIFADFFNPSSVSSYEDFNTLAATLPNLEHIVMQGIGTARYFNLSHFPTKIKILEADKLLPLYGDQNICPKILYQLKGHLNELYVHELFYAFTGRFSFKYIIEEMKLEKFYFANTAYILNREKQYIENYPVFDSTLANAIEIAKHFPGIKGLKFLLSSYSKTVSEQEVESVISHSTTLFNSLQTLDIITYDSKPINRFCLSKYLELYKSCKNIIKLSIKTSCSSLNTVLQECLPLMTKLKEVELSETVPNHNEIYTIISNCSPSLKRIHVRRNQVHLAKEFFEGSQVNIFEAKIILPRVVV